jgi:hypothetical protein
MQDKEILGDLGCERDDKAVLSYGQNRFEEHIF